METIGSLGNVEIYFYLKPHDEKFIKVLTRLLASKFLDARTNNWTENKSIGVDFDLSLLNRRLDNEEEIVFRYQIGNNYLSITLTKIRAVVCIYFRAWNFLDIQWVRIIEHLLTNYQLIIVGFELNFKYDDSDIQSIIDSVKMMHSITRFY